MKPERQATGDWWPHLGSRCLLETGESLEPSCPQLGRSLDSGVVPRTFIFSPCCFRWCHYWTSFLLCPAYFVTCPAVTVELGSQPVMPGREPQLPPMVGVNTQEPLFWHTQLHSSFCVLLSSGPWRNSVAVCGGAHSALFLSFLI